MMPTTNLAFADDRREDRERVNYRSTGIDAAGRSFPLLVVNISHSGLMKRCDAALAPGEVIDIRLPGITVAAEVRWSLGGRVGCEFVEPIPAATYFAMLPRLGR